MPNRFLVGEMYHFYLKMHQNVFRRRAPTGPAGKLTALLRLHAGLGGETRGREKLEEPEWNRRGEEG